jgi:hypothetical protein
VVELSKEDLDIRVIPQPGFAAAGDGKMVVVLDTSLTDELRAEKRQRIR